MASIDLTLTVTCQGADELAQAQAYAAIQTLNGTPLVVREVDGLVVTVGITQPVEFAFNLGS